MNSSSEKKSWVNFFKSCGVDNSEQQEKYAGKFMDQEIHPSQLQNLNEQHLQTIGVDKVGRQLAIINYIRVWNGNPPEFDSQSSKSIPKNVPFPEETTDNLTERIYQRCRKYMFFSKLIGFKDDKTGKAAYDTGDNEKIIITVITKKHAVTALHCLQRLDKEREDLRDGQLGDQFKIYSCHNPDPEHSMDVTVVKCVQTLDYVILESKSKEEFPCVPSIDTPTQGMRAVCLGYPSFEEIQKRLVFDVTKNTSSEKPFRVERQVNEREPASFPVEICALNMPKENLFAASCGLAKGFSGGGLFRTYGQANLLLGICVRGRWPPQNCLPSWRHHRSITYYVYANIISAMINHMEEPATGASKRILTSSPDDTKELDIKKQKLSPSASSPP